MPLSLSDIPQEVFINFFLPLISMKEIGTLIMVDKACREICDQNEIWRVLYLRTIKSNVLDTSVHIGSCMRNCRDGKRAKKMEYYGHSSWRQLHEDKGIAISSLPLATPEWCNNSEQLSTGSDYFQCIPLIFS